MLSRDKRLKVSGRSEEQRLGGRAQSPPSGTKSKQTEDETHLSHHLFRKRLELVLDPWAAKPQPITDP
jgi:hypothetical protein